MLNDFGASRRLAKQLRDALADRDRWQERANDLELKLERRSDFFIEREFRLVDRFLTSQVKTFAITDEIKAKQITEQDVSTAALDDFMAEKKQFLVQCAKEAGVPEPEARAERDFANNYANFVLEFQGQ
jgi:hypothetical protein